MINIAHLELPQSIKELIIYFAERVYNGILNLYVRYDEWMLVEHSQDFTTF